MKNKDCYVGIDNIFEYLVEIVDEDYCEIHLVQTLDANGQNLKTYRYIADVTNAVPDFEYQRCLEVAKRHRR